MSVPRQLFWSSCHYEGLQALIIKWLNDLALAGSKRLHWAKSALMVSHSNLQTAEMRQNRYEALSRSQRASQI